MILYFKAIIHISNFMPFYIFLLILLQAYPIIGIITFACIMGASAIFYNSVHPDVQLWAKDRKALFRGDLKTEAHEPKPESETPQTH